MRLLYVSPGTNVTDPKAGDQVRAWNILKGLSEQGWDVTVLEKAGGDPTVDAAEVRTFEQPLPPRLNDFNPHLYRALRDQFQSAPPDVIQVKTFSGVIAAKVVSWLFGHNAKVLYDAQNFETEKSKSAKDSLPWYKRLAAPHVVRWLELAAVRAADHVVSVSENDRESFRRQLNVPESKISVVPSGSNVVEVDDIDVAGFLDRHDIPTGTPITVFHGYYGYYPNRQAIGTLSENIVPALNKREVDYHIVLAGEGVPEFGGIDEMSSVGYVEDLEVFLAAADLAVVPLLQGGGTKLKVLDYLCAGLPIVTTTVGAQGINRQDGESALIFDDVDDEFVDGICRLLKEPKLRDTLGQQARELAGEKYSWDRIVPQIDDVFTSLSKNEGHPK
jgi:glycosyltransferase involved in cell wall biosynthesis